MAPSPLTQFFQSSRRCQITHVDGVQQFNDGHLYNVGLKRVGRGVGVVAVVVAVVQQVQQIHNEITQHLESGVCFVYHSDLLNRKRLNFISQQVYK